MKSALQNSSRVQVMPPWCRARFHLAAVYDINGATSLTSRREDPRVHSMCLMDFPVPFSSQNRQERN